MMPPIGNSIIFINSVPFVKFTILRITSNIKIAVHKQTSSFAALSAIKNPDINIAYQVNIIIIHKLQTNETDLNE
jgi:hypothetical protein